MNELREDWPLPVVLLLLLLPSFATPLSLLVNGGCMTFADKEAGIGADGLTAVIRPLEDCALLFSLLVASFSLLLLLVSDAGTRGIGGM